jgi:hypothetical protein
MPHSIPIDRSQWSPSSQRSNGGQYDAAATHYEGIAYRCRGCESSCVFSAEAQRQAYEVEKRFVSWFPTLCDPCLKRREALQERSAEYQAKWNTNREVLAADSVFLSAWRSATRELASLGEPNESLDRQLTKLIHAAPNSQ